MFIRHWYSGFRVILQNSSARPAHFTANFGDCVRCLRNSSGAEWTTLHRSRTTRSQRPGNWQGQGWCLASGTGSKRTPSAAGSWRAICSSAGDSSEEEPWICRYEEVVERLESGGAVVVDVRRADEVQSGMMEGAHHIPLDELKQAFDLPADKFEKLYGFPRPDEDGTEVIFSCLAGIRSLRALNIARECGFAKARHYPGGWEEWAEKTKS